MFDIIRISLLFIICVISTITDLWNGKIYNWLTFPGMLLGLTLWTIQNGWNGLLFSTAGLGVGLAIFVIGFLWGGIGAGDIKLVMALGSLTGPLFVLYSIVYTILFALVFSLILYIITGRIKYLFKNIFIFFQRAFYSKGKNMESLKMEKSMQIRFGVFISAGFILRFFEVSLGWNILKF